MTFVQKTNPLASLDAFSSIPFAKPQDSFVDIFERALDKFLAQGAYPMDGYASKRQYSLYFSASTTTTALIIPMYSALSAQTGYDNAQFTSDAAYVSDVFKVYDLTADPSMTNNLYSAFNVGSKTITLTAASDGTSRNWAVFCHGVPYQGIGAAIYANGTIPGFTSSGQSTVFKVVHAPDFAYATSDGYGQSGSYWAHSPMIARLPLNNNGTTTSADADAYTGAALTVMSAGDRSGQTLVKVPLEGIESGYVPVKNTIINPAGTAAYRGIISNEHIRIAVQHASGAAIGFYPFLVKVERVYANGNHDSVVRQGELLLGVLTTNLATTSGSPAVTTLPSTSPSYLLAYTAAGAIDFFRIKGRPVMKGEVRLV